MVRLFAALTLPFDVGETLKRRQSGLPGARWRPLEALHVTLAFYGEMDERRADDLASELSRVAGDPFEIALKGVGAFATTTAATPSGPGSKPRTTACRSWPAAAGRRASARVLRWRRAIIGPTSPWPI